MNILVIGGTKFLGRHLVEAAMKQGHKVTLFNRGNNRDVFPELEQITGDRQHDIQVLEGSNWDAVIDTCGYHPQTVRKSVRTLAKKTNHYAFISTGSVYANFLNEDNVDEQSTTLMLNYETIASINEGEEIAAEAYGHLKYHCEQVVYEEMKGRALIIRPGLIVGPYDPTDRFTYWAKRLAEGREILAPGRKDRKIQFIDVRDLADWTIGMVEKQANGVYNVVGPAEKLTMETFIEEGKAVFNNKTDVTWVAESFLHKHEVAPWIELPLWIPETYSPMEGIKPAHGDIGICNKKAIEAGLTFRSFHETLKDTHDWFIEERGELSAAQLTDEKEQEVLKKWLQAASV
ncbi:NAD-dependent epimerase/dehydratase family protein [Alkalihalobacillus sp. AL-G]|uniref:NAD-dependent epimerase/dehydratase family protein n=1 Tax=Alkalihalobacillus sp. AL-G TaxID=2926399 RepID=UPI00272A3D52|nr:NAD-dependent epimerase/dehydratase family protein [Alkalihalobacillus sp. AL-G]WLD94279.1 NAD-dependent epimerase/dehydratase family protein [Alkalihalobacillus sp. AL-G]